jgi:cation:H+ antiporter
MDAITIMQMAAGLGLLVLGGELLVRGASRLAAGVGVSPLVIGLTVVSYGTSAPELAVSIQAGLSGNPEIAVANVVGSNIFNVLFILGACAAVKPLVVSRQLVRLEVPIMIGLSGLLLVLSLDERLSWTNGALLTCGIIAYSVWTIRRSRKEKVGVETAESNTEPNPPSDKKTGFIALQAIWVGAGLALLVAGARWLVAGAVVVAQALGVSDVVIGLTIVAAGTSLPEVFTSLMATIRNERDIAIGNVVGSNIYNILMIIGVSSMVAPDGLRVAPSLLNFDMAIMLAAALACLPVFFTGYSIARWEGWIFLLCYAAYSAYLIMDATGHDALPAFSHVMLVFALPLLAVTISIITLNSLRNQRHKAGAEGTHTCL